MMQNIGTIVGLIGWFWFLCDTRATAPGYLIGFGLISVVVGLALS